MLTASPVLKLLTRKKFVKYANSLNYKESVRRHPNPLSPPIPSPQPKQAVISYQQFSICMTASLKQNKLTHTNKTRSHFEQMQPLHEAPNLVNFLKDSKFSEDLMLTSNEFQVFSARFLKLLIPYLTWFVLNVTRFIL